MYVVGKKDDLSIVEVSGTYSGGNPPDSIILANVVARYGGTTDDYDVYGFSDTSGDASRVMAGDEFTLVWTGTYPTNTITGLDFSVEDNKLWLHVTTDITQFIADGSDKCDVTFEMWTADNLGVDTSFNGTYLIPLGNPVRVGYASVTFVDGVSTTKSIRTTEWGTWLFPGVRTRLNGWKIHNNIEVLALIDL